MLQIHEKCYAGCKNRKEVTIYLWIGHKRLAQSFISAEWDRCPTWIGHFGMSSALPGQLLTRYGSDGLPGPYWCSFPALTKVGNGGLEVISDPDDHDVVCLEVIVWDVLMTHLITNAASGLAQTQTQAQILSWKPSHVFHSLSDLLLPMDQHSHCSQVRGCLSWKHRSLNKMVDISQTYINLN